MDTPEATIPVATTPGRTIRHTYTHEAMIDLILADPTVTPKELGEVFGYSAGWVSRVLGSDTFQFRLAERKAQLVDPIVAGRLNARLTGVAMQSLEIVSQKLDAEDSATYALEALTIAQKAMCLPKGKRGQG